jgi:hypothetical protein
MNSHLKNFYSDDVNTDNSNNDSINNTTNDNSINLSTNNTLNSISISTPQQQADSNEYEKKIFLLNKKLRSYEKRRQKLFYETKKEKEESSSSSTANANNTTTNSNTSANVETSSNEKNSSKNGSNSGLNVNPATAATAVNANGAANLNTIASGLPLHPIPTTSNLNTSSTIKSANRNGSFISNANNYTNQLSKSTNSDDAFNPLKASNNIDSGPSFYLSPELIALNNNNNDILNGDNANEESNTNPAGQLVSNKSFNAIDRNIVEY